MHHTTSIEIYKKDNLSPNLTCTLDQCIVYTTALAPSISTPSILNLYEAFTKSQTLFGTQFYFTVSIIPLQLELFAGLRGVYTMEMDCLVPMGFKHRRESKDRGESKGRGESEE